MNNQRLKVSISFASSLFLIGDILIDLSLRVTRERTFFPIVRAESHMLVLSSRIYFRDDGLRKRSALTRSEKLAILFWPIVDTYSPEVSSVVLRTVATYTRVYTKNKYEIDM